MKCHRELLFWIVILPLLFVSAMGIGLAATAPAPALSAPQVTMVTLDPTLEPYAPMWQKEIARRFPSAVGILVHGGNFVEDQWIVEGNYASGMHVALASDVVKHYQAIYPDRIIVLLACNTGHLHLNIPGVYYARDSVWCVPDRAITDEMMGHEKEKLCPCTHPSTQPTTCPSSQPTTQPTSSNSPFDPSPAPPIQTRWESDPGVVGNVFEFVTDQ